MNESVANIAALVEQSKAGDRNAFSALVEMNQRMVYALAFQHFRSHPEAQDVAQESFLRAFKNLKSLRKPALFPKWLYGIALNVIREFSRARSRMLPIEILPHSDPVQPAGDPEEERQKDLVLAWLDQLPEKYRIPLSLHYVDGRRHSEIAALLEIPENTVRSRVFRGKEMLAEALAGNQLKNA